VIPDLQCSVVCDDVRQERNGKFILIGLFDMIGLPQFPGLFPRICIVNRWCCGEGSFRERTRIVAPDNGPVVAEGKEIALQLPNAEASATNVEFFLNLRFDAPGVYWIEVLLDGDLTLRYPLRVNKVNPPPRPPAEGAAPA
jgi:hypothetical protein